MDQSTLALQLENVSRRFGAHEVLRDIELHVAHGEWVAIVGPSGCGKTTLLNLMSGYDAPSTGRITRPGRARTVYQADGLFPWLSVAGNIELGLRHLDEKTRQARTHELLQWIGLNEFTNHYPHQLSGGMKQRVEIARAIGGETDVLLLDEPFSSLDYITRLRMRHELVRLLDSGAGRRTVVMVTHDIEEAAQLADRIVLLSGRPASISCELKVDAPQPRSLTHPAVVEATRRIIAELGLEDVVPA
jgi:NitT/TauT family transport system ATP-binding protein